MASSSSGRKNTSERWAWAMLAGSALVYLVSRLVRLEDFPIYFFCDEAVHAVRFREILRNGFHAVDAPQELLPAYFQNGGMLNLSLSVYVHGLVSFFTTPTVISVRATSAVLSFTGGIALALTLRRAFAIKEWWSAVLFSAVVPCWFLHSRTAFETVLMVTSYSWFVYFYLRYREDSARWIYAAFAAGAATFYAYAPGQGVMAVTGVALLIADFAHHRRHLRSVLRGIGFGLMLLMPYLRFRWQHPGMLSGHLKTLGSYWVQDLPLHEKIRMFLENYLSGVSPRFWLEAGYDQAVRHVVPFQAHFPPLLVPFAIVGFALCIIRWRSAPHRLVLIAAVAAPFSSAFVAPMVTRMLACVVPLVLATVLGFDHLIGRIHVRPLRNAVRLGSGLLLTLATIGLLRNGLLEGRLYPDDYGLYGAQWGSQALFRDTLPARLAANPAAQVFVSHLSFNSPEIFPTFFGWENERRVMFAILDDYLAGTLLPEPKDLVVLSAEEYRALRSHPEIERFLVTDHLSLPNGSPGFYVGHLHLNSAFLTKMRGELGRGGLPTWERTGVGSEGASIASSGVERGRTSDVFNGRGEIASFRGEAINVDMLFDAPVELREISVEAAPGQTVTVWVDQPKEKPATLEVGREAGAVQASVKGIALTHIRVEVASQPDGVARLHRIQLRPVNE